MIGPIISVLVSRYIYNWLIENGQYNIKFYLAAIIPLVFPMYRDYKKFIDLKKAEFEEEQNIYDKIPSKSMTMGVFPIGVIIGIIITFWLR